MAQPLQQEPHKQIDCRLAPDARGNSNWSPAAKLVFVSAAGEANVSYEGAAGPLKNGRQKNGANERYEVSVIPSPDDVKH